MEKNQLYIKIEKAMVEVSATKRSLAKMLGMSTENLYSRLKNGKFSYEELEKIADFLDCDLVFDFVRKEHK